jgi:predicted transcriptional regulator
MPKKKLSDMVFQRINPPDHKTSLSPDDLSDVIVRRIGLKRKESRARHDKLLLEMIKYRKENIPLSIEQISNILSVSQSQTYEELRKWRTLGMIEFVKIPSGVGFAKGYMLTNNTVNRLLDRVEASTKSFFRKTRRIAKDFDDLLMLEVVRSNKPVPGVPQPAVPDDEPEEPELDDREE